MKRPRSGRPLRVTVDDCRLLVDLDGRNAVWVAAAQLASAFRMPARWRPPQAPPPGDFLEDAAGPLAAGLAAGAGAGAGVAGSPGAPPGAPAGAPAASGAAGARGRPARLARRLSMPASPTLEGGGELLQMLLRQNQVRACVPAWVPCSEDCGQ